MKVELAWDCSEAGFDSVDRSRLFYRIWRPRAARADGVKRALVFLHRGHEHSGRIAPLVEQFGYRADWAFAWDARGHGHSPGERGDAPSFQALVEDFDAFISHLRQCHGIEADNIVLVANSVGAVIAATWLHDYAPRVRGMIMAAAAFEIKLYVPLAKPALRLAMRFKPGLTISSYIRASMLTHSAQQAAAYEADPLITKTISARVLLGLAETAQRIVQDAAAIDTPILMLAADKDFVVSQKPQQTFFARLSSPLKRYVLLKNCYHAVFYESDTSVAIAASREFIDACYARVAAPPQHYCDADRASHSATRYVAMRAGLSLGALAKAAYGAQRAMLGLLGPLSDGMRIGLSHGFDSGASLDYVYRNRAGGRLLIGKIIDRGYLDAIGWRGIRLRKEQLQQALATLIGRHTGAAPLRILDVAAGSGRYLLETVKRFQERDIELTLRDMSAHNLQQARQLAVNLGLRSSVDYQLRDAFSSDSYPAAEAPYDIVIVSGLYELFSENAMVLRSLQGIASCMKPGGHLIYTGQPWHPQLEMIARTLRNHLGAPWMMRPRPQNEMDALVASAGCHKVGSRIGVAGIFTVSVAQKNAAPAASG
ncbi:alpha-beta hydrolase superfamily lysophospholipase/SAM-dependent methyltransferase [Oxalobacteraceae bacterium GrIS 1.11]